MAHFRKPNLKKNKPYVGRLVSLNPFKVPTASAAALDLIFFKPDKGCFKISFF